MWTLLRSVAVTKIIEENVGRYSVEEEQPGEKPDLERPPDKDMPNFDNPNPDDNRGQGSPPFTGEDLEDIPGQKPGHKLLTM